MEYNTYTDGFFDVGEKFGFLPKREPLLKLPSQFKELQKIIESMPIFTDDGTPGLLSKEGAIEIEISKLPNYVKLIDKEKDPFILQALFRSYAFISSAFTLAPAHFAYIKTGKYGKANNNLPKQIAEPFVKVSKKIDVYPWLDYHYAYSLGNYSKKNSKKGFNWENLNMAAKFSGLPDERGFIMLHVDINQHSPDLIKSLISFQKNHETIKETNKALNLSLKTMRNINKRRQLMWTASRWKHYNDFRIFIMGIKGNEEIFGKGLVYEGVSKTPRQYRGQTGAQDNIIPMMDIFTGIINHYPKNDLTRYLQDLRSYRPKCIQNFLEDLKNYFSKKGNTIIEVLIKQKNYSGIKILLEILEEIYLFRNGHWQFVQKYIMKNTAYPRATGGTPIISWIPNQIKAVFLSMEYSFNKLPNDFIKAHMKSWTESFENKKSLLDKQLEILSKKNYDANKVLSLNKKLNLSDQPK